MLPRADVTTSVERWATIDRFPGYEFSNFGRARTNWWQTSFSWGCPGRVLMEHPRLMRGHVNSNGYIEVTIFDDRGRKVARPLHRLILEAFVGPCPEGREGCHRDGTRTNARLDNLYWGTRSDNMFDRARHGRHLNSRLSSEQIAEAMKLHGEGWSYVALGKRYGVHHASVRSLLMRRGSPANYRRIGPDELRRLQLLDALGFQRQEIAKMTGRCVVTLNRKLGNTPGWERRMPTQKGRRALRREYGKKAS